MPPHAVVSPWKHLNLNGEWNAPILSQFKPYARSTEYKLYSGKGGVKGASSQEGSLFRLKQRFTEDMMQDQVQRVEQKWRRKWKQIKEAA